MAKKLPILTFHAIEDRRSVISFPREVFERGLGKLHKKGYRTIDLTTVIELLRQKGPFPDRSFVITFDDGYQSVYKDAFPVLRRYEMTAAVFLTVGGKGDEAAKDRLPSLEGRPMLTWQEIREMQRAGMQFGAHTCTHPDLARLPFEQAISEIIDSKEIIEKALDVPIASFSYPFGRYDHRIHQFVQGHFDGACSDQLGLVHLQSDPYALERIETYYLKAPKLFDLISTNLFPAYLLFRKVPRNIRRLLIS
jgi:peptidoglycan/xylan/chitin deacetylase (PgdA/CDA1 family)